MQAGVTSRRAIVRSPRVLHVPYNIGGNASGLSSALRDLGWDSTVWTLHRDPYGFPSDKTWWGPSTPIVVREFLRLGAIIQALLRFDIIHYNFGTTMAQPPFITGEGRGMVRRLLTRTLVSYRVGLQRVELWLARRLRKGIFVHYQGDDARQGGYQSSYRISLLNVNPDGYSEAVDHQRQRQINLLDRYADAIYAVNPDLLNALPKRASFIPYSHLDPSDVVVIPPCTDPSRPLVVGHAPTHRGVKGTAQVLVAVKTLADQGVPIQLTLVEGLPHSEAMAAYGGVDVLVDQLFAGWYGGLAVELMAMGKPVLAYVRNEDLMWVPPAMAAGLPIVAVTSDTLELTLRALCTTQRDSLPSIGEASKRFVEDWHLPSTTASRIACDYRKALGRVTARTC